MLFQIPDRFIFLILVGLTFLSCSTSKEYYFLDNKEGEYYRSIEVINKFISDSTNLTTPIIYPKLTTFNPYSVFSRELSKEDKSRMSIESWNSKFTPSKPDQDNFISSLKKRKTNPDYVIFLTPIFEGRIFAQIMPFDNKTPYIEAQGERMYYIYLKMAGESVQDFSSITFLVE